MPSRLTAVASGLVLAIAAAPALAAPNLIVNPGFEAGNFSGWTLGGNADPTAAQVLCVGGSLVKDGQCSAFTAAIGTPVTLSQTFATIAGQAYEVDFWALFDGGNTSRFSATFGGTTLTSLNNPSGTLNFANFVTATGANATLTFSLRDDPGFMILDAVNVAAAVPEPEIYAMLAIGLAALGLRRRRAK